MLNIRNIILAVVLVAVLIFIVPLAAARTEIASNASRGPHSALELQEAYTNLNPAIGLDHQDRYDKMNPVVALDHQDRYDKMNPVSISSYRSPFGECFDVPLRESAACEDVAQTSVSSYRNLLDTCFDVPLKELAACRRADQATAP